MSKTKSQFTQEMAEKLGTSIKEIAADPNDPALKEVPKEQSMNEELSQQIAETIDIAAAKTISEIPKVIENALMAIVRGSLGFERDYRSWRVDHCNGREPVVSQVVKEMAQPVFAKVFKNLFTQKEMKKLLKEQEKAVEQEFKNIFKRKLSEEIRKQATELAEEHAKLIAENIKKTTLDAIPVDISRGFDNETQKALTKLQLQHGKD